MKKLEDFTHIDDGMFFKKAALHQIDEFKSLAIKLNCEMKVVSSHHSKSIELPVVELTMKEVGTFTIRNNFYDINLKADLVNPCQLTLKEFFSDIQTPLTWSWYLNEINRARGYSWKEWSDEEMNDPRILRVKDKRPGVDMWWEKKPEEKDRWMRRMTDPEWYRRDWSSGVLTCDGTFGPEAEIFVQHHAFAEGIDIEDTAHFYSKGTKSFIIALGSLDSVAMLIERLQKS